jgi:hypothetical protein
MTPAALIAFLHAPFEICHLTCELFPLVPLAM